MAVMSRGPGRRTNLWLTGFALAGVIGAHSLAYLIVVPDAHARRGLLEVTGHGYWPSIVAFGFVALVASFVILARRVASGHFGASQAKESEPYGPLVLRLLMLQGAGFVTLEAIERVFLAGHPIGELATEPAFIIGVGLQIVVAVVGALVISAFSTAVRLVFTRVRPRFSSHEAPRWFPLELLLAPASVIEGTSPQRGPPN